MQKRPDELKYQIPDQDVDFRRNIRTSSISRLPDHEGLFGEMHRTSRSGSFDEWGHAWVSSDSQPPVKRLREEKVEVDTIQLRRHALRLCLEQARGSQGIYRPDFGKSRERFVESLKSKPQPHPKPIPQLQGKPQIQATEPQVFAMPQTLPAATQPVAAALVPQVGGVGVMGGVGDVGGMRGMGGLGGVGGAGGMGGVGDVGQTGGIGFGGLAAAGRREQSEIGSMFAAPAAQRAAQVVPQPQSNTVISSAEARKSPSKQLIGFNPAPRTAAISGSSEFSSITGLHETGKRKADESGSAFKYERTAITATTKKSTFTVVYNEEDTFTKRRPPS